MSDPAQGDVWWVESEGDRRPVLVVTRSEALAVLNAVVVAPLTRTVRGIPSELPLGPDEGLPVACAASFDNLRRAAKSSLTVRIGRLGPERRHELRAALCAMSDC